MRITILQAINIIEGNYFAQNKKSTNWFNIELLFLPKF
jgi:hypothetical protein